MLHKNRLGKEQHHANLVRPSAVYSIGDRSSDDPKLFLMKKKVDIQGFFYFFPQTF